MKSNQAFSSHSVLLYYPAPIAFAYRRFCRERDPRARLDALFLAVESTVRYLATLAVSDLFDHLANSGTGSVKLPDHPAFRPLIRAKSITLGGWIELLREAGRLLQDIPSPFIVEVPRIFAPGEEVDVRLLSSLVNQRNKCSHPSGSLGLTEEEASLGLRESRPLLEELLRTVHFVCDYPLCFFQRSLGASLRADRSRAYLHSCMGAHISVTREAYVIETPMPLPEHRPFVVRPEELRLLYLWPLLLERLVAHTGRHSLYMFEGIPEGPRRFLSEIRCMPIDARDPWRTILYQGASPVESHDWIGNSIREFSSTRQLPADPDLKESLRPRQSGMLVGKTLGRNKLLATIGVGGYGTIYLAEAAGGRNVAVKVIEEIEGRKTFIRFQQEFEKLRRAGSHPSIIQCFEWDVQVLKGREYPWYSMEYAEGGDLAGRLEDRVATLMGQSPWSVPELRRNIADEFRAVVRAVIHLHSLDIVHRDIKPGNVLILADGSLCLSDFGLVRNLSPTDESLYELPSTSTGAILGTRVYMAPEQERGDDVDKAADLYSLGILLAELATGKRPEPGTQVTAGSTLASWQPLKELPKAIRTLILRTTDRWPAGRPRTAASLLGAFEEGWEGGGADRRMAEAVSVKDQSGDTTPDASVHLDGENSSEIPSLLLQRNARADEVEETLERVMSRWLEVVGVAQVLKPTDAFLISTAPQVDLLRGILQDLRALHRSTPAFDVRRMRLLIAAGVAQNASQRHREATALFSLAAQGTDRELRALALYNAYVTELVQDRFDTALDSFLRCCEAFSARYLPFSFSRFRPLKIIGVGGYGTTFLCEKDDRNQVAIRTFWNEIKAASQDGPFAETLLLKHADPTHIVRPIEAGYGDSAARRRPYLVMEYFKSISAESLLDREGGRISRDLCVSLAVQIARALREAHRLGVSHLEIKPSNVLIGDGDKPIRVRLVDFGLSTSIRRIRVDPERHFITSRTSMSLRIFGADNYLAPEQRAASVDDPGPWSDLYGMGAMLSALLCNQAGLDGQSQSRTTDLLPEVVIRCLETAHELRPDLDQLLAVLDRGSSRALSGKLRGQAKCDRSLGNSYNPAELVLHEPSVLNEFGVKLRRPKPGTLHEDHIRGTVFQFVWVPGGTFEMGASVGDIAADADEKPAHIVTVDGFWLGKYEVTQAQWVAVLAANPSRFLDDERPVDSVSWLEIQRFLAEAGRGFRLPSEAEWEYAARAGTTGPRYGNLDGVAWQEKNSGGASHAPGKKSPNAFGLYDMLGNVAEWCADWFGPYLAEAQYNPLGPQGGERKVLRGGAWNRAGVQCRASHRGALPPDRRYAHVGFRLAKSAL